LATLYVRSFPDDLYDEIRSTATLEGRSLSAEVVALLAAALGERRRAQEAAEALQRIGARRRSRRPPSTDSLQLLREDRER